MVATNFDAQAYALALVEMGDATAALKSIGVVPDQEGYDEKTWYKRVAERYRRRKDVQEALVKVYSEKAAAEYADCLPLAANSVKRFLTEDFTGNYKAMKAQADIGVKILEDANIALGGSQFKQNISTNREELLDQLATAILGDKGLVEQIVGRAADVIDGTSAQVVSGEADERSTELQTLPEAEGLHGCGDEAPAEDVLGGEPLRENLHRVD